TAECTQAVNAANWAKSTKQSDGTATEIYSVSYGSETSGCTSGANVPAIGGNSANTLFATVQILLLRSAKQERTGHHLQRRSADHSVEPGLYHHRGGPHERPVDTQ